MSLAEKCEQALLTLKESTARGDKEYASLLSNDRGRQIAADKKAVQQFATAVRGDFPIVKDSIDGIAEFKAAVRPLREAAANGIDNYAVTSADRTYFASLLSRINDMNRQLERRQRAVDAIMATTAQSDSGQLTLQKSIEQLESQSMLAMIAEATQVQKQKLQEAIDEQSAVILKAQQERIAAETQLRVQQEKVSANAATRQAESLSKDDAILRAKNRRKQLEKEFEIEKPEIKILLGAFLGGGRMQPFPGKGLEPAQMRLMALGGPISIGGLRSTGALDQTDEGYETLYRLAGGLGNDRLRTGFPNYSTNGMSNPQVVSKVKRASELLNKYGDLLVEKRIIAP